MRTSPRYAYTVRRLLAIKAHADNVDSDDPGCIDYRQECNLYREALADIETRFTATELKQINCYGIRYKVTKR